MDDGNKVGAYLLYKRTFLNLSQEDVVRRLRDAGYTVVRATISNWETGKSYPPLHDPSFRMALSESLHISSGDMLQLMGFEERQTLLSDEVLRIATLMESLSLAEQQLIRNFIELYVRQKLEPFTPSSESLPKDNTSKLEEFRSAEEEINALAAHPLVRKNKGTGTS